MIYADCAATLPVSLPVYEEVCRVMKECWGNPSSIYSAGRQAKNIIEDARERCAALIGAYPDEVFFTSGGSESNNHAIKTTFLSAKSSGNTSPRIIISATSHHSALNAAGAMKEQGAEVTQLYPDKDGLLPLSFPTEDDTVLLSAELINNETGVIQDVKGLSDRAHGCGAVFHADCVAALGHIKIDCHAMGLDIASFSGHKVGAPKGIGILYCKRGLKRHSFIHGGGQERGIRAGTENTAYIAGLAAALEENARSLEEREKKLLSQKGCLIRTLGGCFPDMRVNGSTERSTGGILNISFEGISGDELVLMLDREEICISSGSACAAGALTPSHVLRAMGIKQAGNAVRLSFYSPLREEERDRLCSCIIRSVQKIRKTEGINLS